MVEGFNLVKGSGATDSGTSQWATGDPMPEFPELQGSADCRSTCNLPMMTRSNLDSFISFA